MKSFAAALLTMFKGLASKDRTVNSRGPVAKAPNRYGKLVHNSKRQCTFNAGRNAQKRKVGKGWRLSKFDDRQKAVSSLTAGWENGERIMRSDRRVSGAKINTGARMVLLSDRRLRQRSLAA